MSVAAAVDLEPLQVAAAEVAAAQQRLHERVLAAVAGGASWSEVGRALGLSAGAAQRVHAPRLGPRPRPAPRVQLVRGWVTAAVQRGAGRGAAVAAVWPASSAPVPRAQPVVPAPRPAVVPPLTPSGARATTSRAWGARLGWLVRAVARRVLVRLRR